MSGLVYGQILVEPARLDDKPLIVHFSDGRVGVELAGQPHVVLVGTYAELRQFAADLLVAVDRDEAT